MGVDGQRRPVDDDAVILPGSCDRQIALLDIGEHPFGLALEGIARYAANPAGLAGKPSMHQHPNMLAIRSFVVAFAVFPMLAATAFHPRAEITDRAADLIEAQWEPSFLPMVLEAIRLTRSAEVSAALAGIMERETGAGHGDDLVAWQREMWNAPEARHPRYAAFKSALYSLIGPRFSAYCDAPGNTLIRLDEIVRAGVRQDGIPPLRNPAMLAAGDAGYLEDDHIVFGLSVNGDARAYPKRILAWHEMFIDTVGGVPVAGARRSSGRLPGRASR